MNSETTRCTKKAAHNHNGVTLELKGQDCALISAKRTFITEKSSNGKNVRVLKTAILRMKKEPREKTCNSVGNEEKTF